MTVQFVHAADLHLGSQLEAVGAESERLQQQLQNATYTAFERVVDVTIKEAVDFLVIAGDLYDQKSRSVRANEFLAEQFERLAANGIPVYVIYGNHDPLGDATTYIELPETAHEFGHERPEEFEIPDSDDPKARIMGQSYRVAAEQRRMHTEFDPPSDGIPTIGVLHTGLDPDGTRYVPSSVPELVDIAPIDYWALGHIHQPRVYRTDPPVIHPGVPQGRHAGEAGPGGCVLVELDSDSEPKLEYVPTSPVVWLSSEVSVDDSDEFDLTTIDGIQRRIEHAADDLSPGYDQLETALGIPVRRPEWDPEGYVCRWSLTGRGSINEFLSTDEPVLDRVVDGVRKNLANARPFVYTDTIEDRTGPPLPDIETLRQDDDVVDKFLAFTSALDRDQSTLETMRAQLDYDNTNNVWQVVEDPEEVDDNRLALTDDRLENLVDRAEERVLNELIRRRVD